ncbi:MAG TPA: TetR/AcrR family transcriptional regulator [Kofleriaceae bacterium]|nr:TetR/AcrR family transcriptional regulator [Kofleriaceae bacterium]
MSALPARTDEADKRSAILAAALELFMERGYYGTAVPAVAERAGVGAGTIYRYFKSKEDLVNALYRQCKEALAMHVLVGISPTAPPREQFHELWVRLAGFTRANPRIFSFLELHHHASYLDDDSRAVERRVLDLATSFVAKLQAAKVVKPISPEVLMAIVYWSFVGLARCEQEGRLVLDDENLAAAEQCVWEAIRF